MYINVYIVSISKLDMWSSIIWPPMLNIFLEDIIEIWTTSKYLVRQKITEYIDNPIYFYYPKISKSSLVRGFISEVDKYLSSFGISLTNDDHKPLSQPIQELIRVFLNIKKLLLLFGLDHCWAYDYQLPKLVL